MAKVEFEYGNIFMGRQEKAQYVELDDEMFRHNPYLEALPELIDDDLAQRIARKPAYDSSLRQHSAQKRLDYVLRIGPWVLPMPMHIILAQRIMRIIKQGYMTRNPITAEWVRQLRAAFPGADVDENNASCFLRLSANGLVVFGPSGIGKTLTIETILYLLPQVIYHNQYNGQAFDRVQIVWLKVDSAKDGSSRGLCRAVFKAIDKLLGTRYFDQYFHYTARDAIEVLAHLLWVLGVGVLIIDEIQRLNLASSGGEKELIHFFSSLQKNLRIPVILIGTFSAMNLFLDEFSCARPLCSSGDLIWGRYEHTDQTWEYFINALWEYQFTNVETRLTKSLKDALYKESQGITDIAVKIYMLAQWEVIGTKDERITPKVIKAVADRHLNLLRPMLTAVRTGDIERLRKIRDLHSPIEEAMLNEAARRAQERVIDQQRKAKQMSGQSAQSESSKHSSPEAEIADLLVGDLGFDVNLAWFVAKEVIDKSPKKASMRELKQSATRLALAHNEGSDKVEVLTGLPGNTIRECLGKETESPYDQMKKQGITLDMKQFVET
ncbi:MAG: ATP-binding protein [Sporomusaceae bacterium]|nr:ATP-binding protein [Sporomusaceae bacterium]